jgi:hypothetical protein
LRHKARAILDELAEPPDTRGLWLPELWGPRPAIRSPRAHDDVIAARSARSWTPVALAHVRVRLRSRERVLDRVRSSTRSRLLRVQFRVPIELEGCSSGPAEYDYAELHSFAEQYAPHSSRQERTLRVDALRCI